MRKFLVISIAAFLLAGCLQMETKVKINKNGSGTIEQQMIVRSDMLQMFQGMQGGGQKDGGLIDEKQLKSDAGKMGAGVRFVSVTPLKTDAGEGYKAVYAFDDVTKLKVNSMPGGPFAQGGMGAGTKKDEDDAVSFQFKKGSPSTLTILMKQDAGKKEGKKDREDKEEKGGQPEMDPSMLEQFYKGMKISMVVEMQGTITDTNAEFRSGNTVTLIGLDFDSLLGNKEAMNTLMQGKVDSVEDMKAFTKKYPGIKIETKDKVQVSFK